MKIKNITDLSILLLSKSIYTNLKKNVFKYTNLDI